MPSYNKKKIGDQVSCMTYEQLDGRISYNLENGNGS